MSVGIYLKDISDEHLSLIKNLLTIKPKLTFFDLKRKRWKKKEDPDDSSKEDILFFKIKDNAIYIPYIFYEKMTGNKANLLKIQYGLYTSIKAEVKGKLFETQVSVYEQLLAALMSKGTANLNVYTGFGKTVVSAIASINLKLRVLILINNTILAQQWKSTYNEFTTANVYVVDSAEEPPKDAEVIICMSTRVHYLSQNFYNSIGTLIIDEAHTFCTPSRVEALLCTQPKYIIAATATLEREQDGLHVMIEAMCGSESIYKKSVKPFNAILYNTGYNAEVPHNRYGEFNWTQHVNNLCNCGERNQLIIDLITNNLSCKILVLTGRQNHVLDLHDRMQKLSIKVDYMVGNKKKYSDSNVLIGTVKKLGTGFDERTACLNFEGFPINLLIIVISIKKTALLAQTSGRCFRSQFPSVICLYDQNGISDKHMEKNTKWFESVNGIVTYVESEKAKRIKTSSDKNSADVASAHISKYLKK